jgi:hypothetical protein
VTDQLGWTDCPLCRARVQVLTDERTGDEVVADAWPSVHGSIERRSIPRRTCLVHDERKPGRYRLHVETCGRA